MLFNTISYFQNSFVPVISLFSPTEVRSIISGGGTVEVLFCFAHWFSGVNTYGSYGLDFVRNLLIPSNAFLLMGTS